MIRFEHAAQLGLRRALAIDLGTSNSVICLSGDGIVLDEPSMIAIRHPGATVVETGEEARHLLGREPLGIEVVKPVVGGVIADFDACVLMLQAFLRRAWRRHSLLRPSAAVAIPSGATAVERRAVLAAIEQCRPHLSLVPVEQTVAAALGVGADPDASAPVMVVQMGGGVTEAAAVAGMAVVRVRSIRIGGTDMDEAIVHAVKTELGLLLGHKTAERLKIRLGLAASTGAGSTSEEVIGVDPARGMMRPVTVPGDLVSHALDRIVASIIDAVDDLVSTLPPDLADDMVLPGSLWLSGGGALLPGLARRFEQATGMAVSIPDDPMHCVVTGAAAMLARAGSLHGSSAA